MTRFTDPSSKTPPNVPIEGRDEVVVTGQALIDALQASPYRDIEMAPQRTAMPVRDASL